MLQRGQVVAGAPVHRRARLHRAAHRSLGPMVQQTRSLCRYFKKWGFKF